MNTVFRPFNLYSQRCTQLNTIAIMSTAFKVVFESSKQWPVYRPRYTGFFIGLGCL